MLLDVKAAFEEMLTELDWMDVNTRARAHNKLNAIRPFVGIPEWINNSTKLEKFHEGVSFSVLEFPLSFENGCSIYRRWRLYRNDCLIRS